ncbi:putative reverse transcriptase domain-containing protein [Tanacetum coccineum]
MVLVLGMASRVKVERELAISKNSVSKTVRWISYGPRATIVKYEAYNINGYTFRTKSNDGIVYQNSGVSVEAVDLHISKEVATTRKAFYYGVLQEIWVLDYRFRQIPLFKCDWVNHKAGGVKHDPNLSYTLINVVQVRVTAIQVKIVLLMIFKENIPSGKRIALLENEHSKSFAKWLREEVERELAISKDSVSETVRWISYGPRATIVKYEAYNINGYTFRTKSNDGIVYQNSGVSVEAVDLHISKEVATTRKAFYYGVLQEIWVLDYRFRQIPLFKCDWVNHKAGGVKHDPNLGYTLVDLNSLGHKDDPFILASQARQVFYVKDQIDKKLSIVFRTPTKNYKDTYDEVDEEFSTVIHEHNDNILPRVNRRDLGNESQNDYYRTDCEEPI